MVYQSASFDLVSDTSLRVGVVPHEQNIEVVSDSTLGGGPPKFTVSPILK